MQKRLVNEAIGRGDLAALGHYGLLFVLGALSATGLKFAINLYEALIAERVLRDFRGLLYERILALPVAQLRRTPPAQTERAPELRGFQALDQGERTDAPLALQPKHPLVETTAEQHPRWRRSRSLGAS
jgi:hypothetical protein